MENHGKLNTFAQRVKAEKGVKERRRGNQRNLKCEEFSIRLIEYVFGWAKKSTCVYSNILHIGYKKIPKELCMR